MSLLHRSIEEYSVPFL